MPDTISMLYDAAIGEEEWEFAIGAMLQSIGAGVLSLGVGNPLKPDDPTLWNVGLDMTLLPEAGYSFGDVWDPTVNPGVAAGMVMPAGRSMHVCEMVPEDVVASSDFLQSTLFRSGVTSYRLFRLHAPPSEPELLAGGLIAKSPGVDFDSQDISRIDDALSHLGRAIRLRTQVGREQGVAWNLSALVENLAYGVMLLDRHGEVVLMNARCEALRARGDGIAVIRRRPDLGPAANAAIAAALGVVDLGAGGFPSVQGVPIPRRSGLPPYLARVYPGIGFASLAGAGAVRVAVLIDDPLDPDVLPDPALLREMFGLTPAEAAVAQLIPRLLARRAIAAHLGLSENTVKTHLATIRAKLGARTTAEMIRLLVRATLGPPG